MDKDKFINEIEVVNLADDTKHIEEMSAWVWEEWSKQGGAKLEDIIYRTRHSICIDKVPQVYIAKHGEELVGTASIWHNDLTTRQDLTPWLAALYIKKEHRGRGVGTVLQNKIIEVAKELGYDNIYLITEHENYYEKTGWKFMEIAPIGGNTIRLYGYDIK